MENHRWREIERIFDEMLELPETEQTAFLAQACRDDESLQREVTSLLVAHRQANGFLGSQAAPISAKQALEDSVTLTTQRIGAYQLLRELAQGGMGTVWLAERADEQYQQQVAIKLLKTEHPDIAHRLRHERQILASLNHPNIARLLDGGTTDSGQPYLVMEYIEGVPIDVYCQQQQLSLRERLQLFRQVCSAVQYAHQHLIIHRDLKPANILVTADGTPKLLDFGIAKLLQPDLMQSFQTQAGQTPMTPAYASPEQVRNETLTTTSDVYSLGVVLYELLTGRSPYQLTTNTFGELAKAICEQEPTRPSAQEGEKEGQWERATTGQGDPSSRSVTPSLPLSFSPSQLRGDLDSIVLMALRKEPNERYASVEQFSTDIQRYLAGLPTLARKGTLAYRAVKYVRRYKVPVAAAALILLSLVGGIGATSRQAQIARAEQAKAEAQRIRAEQALAVADEQRRLAEQALAEVEAQRTRAENALTTAEQRRRQAEAARAEANQQRAVAETQRLTAEAERNVAQTQRQRAETQELSNRQLLYTSRMGLAHQAWNNANIERMRELLTPYLPQPNAPDYRGFEWYYLWRLSHQEERSFALPGLIHLTAFSLDSTQLLTVAAQQSDVGPASLGTEVVWRDAATGEVLRRYEYPAVSAGITALTRDRSMLAMARLGDKVIRVVSLTTGAELYKMADLQGGLSCFAFTPNGNQMIAGFSDGSISLLELPSGREIYRIKKDLPRIFTVAIAPDGQRFITGSADHKRNVYLWDLASGTELFALGGVWAKPQNALFSPDGRIVVVSGNGLTTAWEAATGKQLMQLENRGRRLAFTPDSRTLIIGGEDAAKQSEITFLDTTTWKDKAVQRGHGNVIFALAVSPDGQRLASGAADHTVKLWDLTRERADDSLYDPRKMRAFAHIVLTPDGKRLLTGQKEQSVTVWDMATRQEITTLRHRTPLPPNSPTNFHVAVSADSQWYATGNAVEVKVWEAATGKEVFTLPLPTPATALSFAPDGTLAVSIHNTVQLWEPRTGKARNSMKVYFGGIVGLRFAADSASLYVASTNSVVSVWDVATGQMRREYRCGNAGIETFALSADERLFATGSREGTARLWDTQTGRELFVFKGHAAVVTALAFSLDNRRLVTGSQDHTVRLWDVTTGEELLVFKENHSWIADNSIGFSPDGKLLYAGDWDRNVCFWRAATEAEITSR